MEIEIGFPGGLRVDARVGDMVVSTDQGTAAGGEGSAPSPFQLFLASIGACAGFYVLQFCRQRGIPTDGIRLLQRHGTAPGSSMIQRIDLVIEVPPTFPEHYVRALERVAAQCTVKKHLEQPPLIQTSTRVLDPRA
jgi:ribosomal protein S12 methylthiotransferase accessory factor